MFHSRTLNKCINKIHERTLRLVNDDNVSSLEELLNKDNSFTIHERNIQTLVFPLKESPKYCSKNIFSTRNTVKYGTESLAH